MRDERPKVGPGRLRETSIPIYCTEERMVVGTIDTEIPPNGEVKITGLLAWDRFVPVDERFKLERQAKDGDRFECPNCVGWLSLRGDLQIENPRTNEEGKRERAVAPDETVPIVFGATVVRY